MGQARQRRMKQVPQMPPSTLWSFDKVMRMWRKLTRDQFWRSFAEGGLS